MTEAERRESGDALRFANAVLWLPPEVGFLMTRSSTPSGGIGLINPYECRVVIDGIGGVDKAAAGGTMFEALMRAVADAYERKAISLRATLEEPSP